MVFSDSSFPVNVFPFITPSDAFVGGPLAFEAGTVYTFDVQNTGSGVQAFVGSFEFSVIPIPPAVVLFAPTLGLLITRRRTL